MLPDSNPDLILPSFDVNCHPGNHLQGGALPLQYMDLFTYTNS